MKKLYLIRHAKSSWDNLAIDDFQRPLNGRGIKDAPRMGKRLKERSLTADLVLSSPAKRALDTCLIITKILGFSKEKINTDKRLYHASEEELLRVIRELKDHPNDEEENVLLFGHNPGLTNFANHLLNEHIQNIPTTGIVAASLSIKKWQEVDWGCGKLLFFDFPKSKED